MTEQLIGFNFLAAFHFEEIGEELKNMEINRKNNEINIMPQWVIYQFIFRICFSIDSMEGLSVLAFLAVVTVRQHWVIFHRGEKIDMRLHLFMPEPEVNQPK